MQLPAVYASTTALSNALPPRFKSPKRLKSKVFPFPSLLRCAYRPKQCARLRQPPPNREFQTSYKIARVAANGF